MTHAWSAFVAGGPRSAAALLLFALAVGACTGSAAPPQEPETPAARSGERSAAPSREAMGVPPTGGGGFQLGMTQHDAELACADQAGRWGVAGSGNVCERPPGRGLDSLVLLDFCESELCWIHVVTMLRGTADEEWLGAFGHLGEELERRHGPATQVFVEVPEECRGRLLQCLAQERARAVAVWRWSSGQAVILRLAGGADTPATLSVSFANARGVERMEGRADALH